MKPKDQVYLAFSRRFRQALLELGYSPAEQKRLGELFGVSGQAVRRWAEGEALPASARMPNLAAVLGVRREWLQDGIGTMRPIAVTVKAAPHERANEPKETLNQGEVDLLRMFRKLGLPQQEAVCDLVKVLRHH